MSLLDENILSTAAVDGIEVFNFVNGSSKCLFGKDSAEMFVL